MEKAKQYARGKGGKFASSPGATKPAPAGGKKPKPVVSTKPTPVDGKTPKPVISTKPAPIGSKPMPVDSDTPDRTIMPVTEIVETKNMAMSEMDKEDETSAEELAKDVGKFVVAREAITGLRADIAGKTSISPEERRVAEQKASEAEKHIEEAEGHEALGLLVEADNALREAGNKAHLAEEIAHAKTLDKVANHASKVLHELSRKPAGSEIIADSEIGMSRSPGRSDVRLADLMMGEDMVEIADSMMKETSVAETTGTVKHKAKATSEDIEGLISPVLKELEGRVALLETTALTGKAGEMSVRERIDMVASAVAKEELSEEARLAALEEFYKVTK